MGKRKDIINAIAGVLDRLQLPNGDLITVYKTFVDPLLGLNNIPYVSVVPEPENVRIGLWGDTEDNSLRIAIFGYCGKKYGESLFDVSEDMVETIKKAIADQTNADIFHGVGFSCIDMGPILNEQMDIDGNLAYISVPINTVYIDD